MEVKETPVSQFYYKYKTATDEEILNVLDKVKIVVKKHNGEGTIYGYYPLDNKAIDKLKEKLRKVSLTFDATSTDNEPISDLVEYKSIEFLCKCPSRFFLKPDIGEVVDQIHFRDMLNGEPSFDAIHVLEGHRTLPGTQEEHHLMRAVLLKKK